MTLWGLNGYCRNSLCSFFIHPVLIVHSDTSISVDTSISGMRRDIIRMAKAYTGNKKYRISRSIYNVSINQDIDRFKDEMNDKEYQRLYNLELESMLETFVNQLKDNTNNNYKILYVSPSDDNNQCTVIAQHEKKYDKVKFIIHDSSLDFKVGDRSELLGIDLKKL